MKTPLIKNDISLVQSSLGGKELYMNIQQGRKAGDLASGKMRSKSLICFLNRQHPEQRLTERQRSNTDWIMTISVYRLSFCTSECFMPEVTGNLKSCPSGFMCQLAVRYPCCWFHLERSQWMTLSHRPSMYQIWQAGYAVWVAWAGNRPTCVVIKEGLLRKNPRGKGGEAYGEQRW